MKLKLLLATAAILAAAVCFAQGDTARKFTFSGYAELYYSFDFSKPQNHEKPGFVYNHKRHNEVSANLLLARANYTDKNIRANIGIMAGGYAEYNLSAEPDWAKLIYEANIGVKLLPTANLWLDAGIMPSHIGFESAISADCWTLTRSLAAENSPYYETGVKLGYTNKKENLYAALLVLNGWQKIRRPDGMQNPSFGIQVNYKPSSKLLLNYSNFIGSDKPDSLNAFRVFHNVYLQYEPTAKAGFILGVDIGTDKNSTDKYGTWLAPVIIFRYAASNRLKVALRGERYNDRQQVIVSTGTPNGFRVTGISANADYYVNNKVLCRIEGKIYQSKDKIFSSNADKNYAVTTSMSIKL